jgi:outer membrane protein assembly factor BamB
MKNIILTTLFLLIFIVGEIPCLFTASSETLSSFSDERVYYLYHTGYNQAELNENFQKDSGFFSDTPNRIQNRAEKGGDILSTDKGSLDSPWPMVSHDVFHSGKSPYNTTQPPEGIEIWRFSKSDSFDDGTIIDDKGILYFGCEDSNIYAVYPNGMMKWKTRLTDPSGFGVGIGSTPAIDEDGIIYVGTREGIDGNYLYVIFSENGTVKWRYATGNSVDSSPAIGTDGTIYFGDWSGYVYALRPDGSTKWKYHTGDIITGSPAIGSDGIVYIGSHDSILYALNPNNGTVKWKFDTGGWIRVNPCIGDDGTVYCVSFDNYLYAIYSNNGTMKWRTFVNAGTNPTVGPDGTIYAGWDVLYAINPDGFVKWNYTVNGHIEGGTPCTSSEGIIYLGTSAGSEIVAINPNGTLRWRCHIGVCQSPPAIGFDGTIYIGSESPGAAIHAFGRGPLDTEIYGPYEGSATVPIQFTGDIFGGIPPYTCHWDFGDNQTSSERNPKHAYSHYGVYTVTFTVTDDQGNQSNDSSTVNIHFPPPTAEITKPVNGIYIMNMRILPYQRILIFGPITIKVEASQEQFGISRVYFYVLSDYGFYFLKGEDSTPPYTYIWKFPYIGKAYIAMRVVDKSGNYTDIGEYVWKFL